MCGACCSCVGRFEPTLPGIAAHLRYAWLCLVVSKTIYLPTYLHPYHTHLHTPPIHTALAADAIRRMGVRMYHVSGRSSDAAALHAAGANSAHSLVYLGPSERPTHLPAAAVSGMYGDPTSTREGSHADLSGSSRWVGGVRGIGVAGWRVASVWRLQV